MNSPPNEPNLLLGEIYAEGKSKWLLKDITQCSQKLQLHHNFHIPSNGDLQSKAASGLQF